MRNRTVHTRAAHHVLKRIVRRIGLALVLLLIAALVYRTGGLVPADARSPQVARDPAAQGFVDYLRAHTGAAPPPVSTPADVAQQAVMSYLRVHSTPTPAPSSLWDAAAGAAREYVRAHSH